MAAEEMKLPVSGFQFPEKPDRALTDGAGRLSTGNWKL
jgi:hypothetical protein